MSKTDIPINPIAAVVHADPYPYYAALRAGPPLVFDVTLRLWIAAQADVVAQVLAHPALRVRPAAEPVPLAIAGTPAGELFGQLVRMNDGPLHDAHRPVLQRALAQLDLARAHDEVRRVAAAMAPDDLNDWCLTLPVSAMACLLGFDAAHWPALARWTRDFVTCLSPLSNEAQLRGASEAARQLLQCFERLIAAPRPGSLLDAVCVQAQESSAIDRRVLLCNLIGLLSQTCDATAGLLGNCIVALAREPGLHAAFARQHAGAAQIVAEVALHDPSVHNTRRFVAEPLELGGAHLAAGNVILVVLAAAQHDPQFNPAAERFDLARPTRRLLGFGHGRHACPGQALAHAIAAAGLDALRDARLRRADSLPMRWHYRPSVNGRMPVFDAA